MITIQIVLHIRDLDLLGGWLIEQARCKVEGKMIVDVEDHRIEYRADRESSMYHTLMIYLELLLLCVGIST
jgi:hypothetical protein